MKKMCEIIEMFGSLRNNYAETWCDETFILKYVFLLYFKLYSSDGATQRSLRRCAIL
jgi:hypothetical protein